MKKILLILAGLLAAGAVIFATTNSVRAEDIEYPPFVQELAQRFNLNEDEVKAFFDEERLQRQQEHQAQMEERLDEAVAEGKLTQEQKTYLLEHMQNKGQNREEFQAWVEEQGLDLHDILGMGPGMGPRPGFGGEFKPGPEPGSCSE